MADPVAIERLKEAVLAKFGRTLDSPTDYDLLSATIERHTGDMLSSSTLKRLFGYNKQQTSPRPSTLSTLARYVGFAGWSDFYNSLNSLPEEPIEELKEEPKKSGRKMQIRFAAAGVAILLIGLLWIGFEGRGESAAQYEAKEGSGASLSEEPSPKELIMRTAMERTRKMCERVRCQRDNLDVFKYKKLIDSEYYPFLFDTISGYIREHCNKTFDKADAEEAYAEIFSACQNMAIELYRESSGELNKAVFGSPHGPSQPGNQVTR